MKQTIRRYGGIGNYGVNQNGHDAMSITYHGTDHHGVCDHCGAEFTRGWIVTRRAESDDDAGYCLNCVTVVPAGTPDVA